MRPIVGREAGTAPVDFGLPCGRPTDLAGNTAGGRDASGCMSVLDTQASEDFAADWAAWHKKHQDRLAAPDGFLAITSINWLTETPARFPDAPGEWAADGDGITVRLAPGEELTLDGVGITGRHRFGRIPERGGLFPSDADGAYEVAKRGGNDILRPRHPDNPLR